MNQRFLHIIQCIFAVQIATCAEFINVCLYKTLTKKDCFEFGSMKSLKENMTQGKFVSLEVINNNLPTLPSEFLSNIYDVQEIWLVRNNISTIEPGAFTNLSYTSIYLGENKIKRIEFGVFTNLTDVFSVSLPKNLIDFIHKDAFTNMTNLREINLSHNRLKTWNSEWFNRTQLISLDVSHNMIESLPNRSFQFAESHGKIVHKINMKNNRIRIILNNTFEGLPKVNYLYFSINEITTVGQHILRNTNATYFDISWNKIECLPDNLENIFKSQCTSLKHNPFNCSCHKKIVDWAQKNGKCIRQDFNRYCESKELQ